MILDKIATGYRLLPGFHGKRRLGGILFRRYIHSHENRLIKCRDGLQFYLLNTIDSVGRDLFFDGRYEPETISLILSLLGEGDIMIDAGANIGSISIPVSGKKDVLIYAFEPAHEVFEVLKKNIAINGTGNIIPVAEALSDNNLENDFYESDRVHGWSGMAKIDSFNHYTVPSVTLDSFAENNDLQTIKILKADVQGWEYRVFKGAERLLNESGIEHIIFEFEWWAEKNAGLEPGTAQQFLLEKGYRLQTFSGVKITAPLTEGTVMIHARRE